MAAPLLLLLFDLVVLVPLIIASGSIVALDEQRDQHLKPDLARKYDSSSSPREKSEVYLVLVRGSPVVHYRGDISGFPATAAASSEQRINSDEVKNYASYLASQHDHLLAKAFDARTSYRKLYSYHHLINGFAVELTATQAGRLRAMAEVIHVERDERVQTMTTHTPEYMGLPTRCWPKLGGVGNAGQGVVIGIVDTGIDPSHPSFKRSSSSASYLETSKFTGKCEIADEFPRGSCSGKIVGAQHFAQAAIASGEFNASVHYASPLDGDGHGTHTAATAAGNNGVPVIVNGFNYGSSSGMAPEAKIAVYKALYRYIGGFFADVVAAIDQAVADGVDVLSLSVGPNGLPRRNLTFMSTFDLALLSAVKAGVFVTQAVGNGGPYPRTSLSFSPWIFSVAAATHDRTYPNAITLGSNITVTGIGLAPGSNGTYNLITAADAAVGNASRSASLVDECQDADSYNSSRVSGKILVCSYSLRYLFGVSTLEDAVSAAKALNASGLAFLATPDLDGHSFPPSPIAFPAIIIPGTKDAAVLLHYYNSSTLRDGSGKFSSSSATAAISGGQEALLSFSAPKVATYSSRGPDVNSNNMDVADVLKPNILAPGNLIWAAWSSQGTDEREFEGQEFAMISGTSMATPHIAGIAALVKQQFPALSPAGIASAMATTALTVDTNGQPLLAQHPSGNVDSVVGPATAFDFGSGFVDPAAAIDPGLIFDAGFQDYVQFLCSIPTLSNSTVSAATGMSCLSPISSASSLSSNTTGIVAVFASDLNTPYVSIASLNGARTVIRIATSVGDGYETYNATLVAPAGVSVAIQPSSFSVSSGQSLKLTLTLKALVTSSAPSFGELLLHGDRGHHLHVPICVSAKIATNTS